MKRAGYAFLVCRALYEIVRYEIIACCRGTGCILSALRQQSFPRRPSAAGLEQAVCDAVLFATCLYWKPVLCLQRSVCTVRLLRKCGVDARMAIGYRPAPFFSHAWVEVEGRVVYGSPAYQKRLQLLYVA